MTDAPTIFNSKPRAEQRHFGKLANWIGSRDFGFIACPEFDDEVFVHEREFELAGIDVRRIGMQLSFRVRLGRSTGKPQCYDLREE